MTVRTVLYVEDDPVSAVLMQGIVELHGGVDMAVAVDGAEARRRVAQGGIHLLLCDLHLPDTHGAALLPELRAAGLPADVPALLVTAEGGAVAAQCAHSGGFDDHWTKPLDVADTLRGLERWLLQRR
jgi:CheY-like chemotaxis protein